MKVPARLKKGSPCCYILRCADGSLYTGWTSDLARRVTDHAAGRGGRYTRSHRPVELVYAEPQADASAARKREAQIKKLGRVKKEELFRKKKGSRRPTPKPGRPKRAAPRRRISPINEDGQPV